MTREKATKRAMRILFIIYAVILVAETAFAVYGSSHHTVELLTVGFPQLMLILLLMDIPIFIILAVVVNAVKEVAIYQASYNKDKKRLTAILISFVFAVLTVLLFVFTSNSSSPTVNTIFYCGTIITAVATLVSFAVYGRSK